MKATIVKMGDSQGICIPDSALQRCALSGEVEVEVHDHRLVIRAARRPRDKWDEAFEAMAASGDDRLLDVQAASSSTWDQDEWEW